MSEKMPNPFEKVSKPAKALGLAAALHAGVYYSPEIAEKGQEAVEIAQEAWEDFTLNWEREQVLERAEDQIENGDLDFWQFARETDRIDIEYADRTPPRSAEIEREFAEARERLEESLEGLNDVQSEQDLRRVQGALSAAFEGYHYELGNGGDVLTVFSDHGGKCDQISLAVLSLLDQEGFGDQLALRAYPAGEGAPGHWAPTLSYTDVDGRLHEHDLVGGGAVTPGGTRLSLPDIVRAYEESDHSAGWNIVIHHDRDARPFPNGIVPLYSENMIGAYHTDAHGNLVSSTGEMLASRESDGAVGVESWQDELLHIEAITAFAYWDLDRVITRSPHRAVAESDAVEFRPRHSFDGVRWTDMSEQISWAESRLRTATSDQERVRFHGLLVSLYRTASLEAALARRSQTHELAETKIREHLDLARPIVDRLVAMSVDTVPSDFLETDGFGMALMALDGAAHDSLVFMTFSLKYQEDQLREYALQRRGFFHARIDLMRAAILNPELRAAALEQAGAMSVYEQFVLAESVNNIYLSGQEEPRGSYAYVSRANPEGDGPILQGDDSFSVSYRERQQLFRLIYYHLMDPAPQDFQVIMNDIHTYAHEGGHDDEWIRQVQNYLVHYLEQIPPLPLEGDDLRDAGVRMIMHQATLWAHDRPETEAYADRTMLELHLLD